MYYYKKVNYIIMINILDIKKILIHNKNNIYFLYLFLFFYNSVRYIT